MPILPPTSADMAALRFGTPDDTPFETLEIKRAIPIDRNLMFDAVKKSRNATIKRCYISTAAKDNFLSKEGEAHANKFVLSIKNDTGVDIIPNGIYPSIKYYLRFVSDYKQFIHVYTKNLIIDADDSTEARHFHIAEWRNVLERTLH